MPILTVTQAANRLSITPEGVLHLIRVGTLPATRFGPVWVLRDTDVEAAKVRPGRGRPKGCKPRPADEPEAEPAPAPPPPVRRFLCLSAPPPGLTPDFTECSAGIVTASLTDDEAEELGLMAL